MNRQFVGQTAGNIYDAELLATDAKGMQGRMPQIGDYKEFDDGRKFRYVSSKIALTAAEPVSMATASDSEVAFATAASAGATSVTPVTLATAWFGGGTGVIAADRFAEGYMCINDDAGEGYMYKIKSNTAGTSAVNSTFTLYDPLKVAVDTTTTDVMLIGPKYKCVVAGSAALQAVGVAVVPCTGTSEYYFWAQTKGPAQVLTGSATIGLQQVLGSGVVKDAAAADVGLIVVGVALGTSANGSGPIDLCIE
jgi:hypothetical protein